MNNLYALLGGGRQQNMRPLQPHATTQGMQAPQNPTIQFLEVMASGPQRRFGRLGQQSGGRQMGALQ